MRREVFIKGGCDEEEKEEKEDYTVFEACQGQ